MWGNPNPKYLIDTICKSGVKELMYFTKLDLYEKSSIFSRYKVRIKS